MDKNSICPHCRDCFNNRTNLKSHIQDVHNKAFMIYCHLCTYSCSGAYLDLDIEMHLFLNHRLTAYKCNLCLFVIHDAGEIVNHFSKFHSDLGEVTLHKLLRFIQRPLSLSYIQIATKLTDDYGDYKELLAISDCSYLPPNSDSSKLSDKERNMKIQNCFHLESSNLSTNKTEINVNSKLLLSCTVSNNIDSVQDVQKQSTLPNSGVYENSDINQKTSSNCTLKCKKKQALNSCNSATADTLTVDQTVQLTEEASMDLASTDNDPSEKITPTCISSNNSNDCFMLEHQPQNTQSSSLDNDKSICCSCLSDCMCIPAKITRQSLNESLSVSRRLRGVRITRREKNSTVQLLQNSSCSSSLSEDGVAGTPEVSKTFQSDRSYHRSNIKCNLESIFIKEESDLKDNADIEIKPIPVCEGSDEDLCKLSNCDRHVADKLRKAASCSASHYADEDFVELGYSNWPKQYHINQKVFSFTLKKALEAEEILSTRQRKALLEYLYNDIINYTYLPTPNNYDEVVKSLLSTYPHLYRDISYADAKNFWKTMLSRKARNSRQYRDRDVPCVMANRTKFKSCGDANKQSPVSDRPKPKKIPARIVQKFLPFCHGKKYVPFDHGTASLELARKHIAFMKAEWVKCGDRDMGRIDDYMAQTFPHRRDCIVNQNLDINELMEMYPALFDCHQIYSEFHRLTKIQVVTEMRTKVMEYSKAILLLSDSDWVDQVEPRLTDEGRDEALACLALVKVPKLLSEHFDFKLPSKTITAPMLHFAGDPSCPDTEGTLTAEGVLICPFKGLVMGVTLWAASYYVLNYTYPAECRRTLVFLQKAMLGLTEMCKSGALVKIMTVIQKLNALKAKMSSNDRSN